MLTLTENATNVVKGFAEQIPDAAGLRITAGPVEEPALEVTTAATAEPGDAVVEQDGAKVFLDPNASLLLDDKVLDAVVDGEGQVEFAVGEQTTA